MSTPTASIAGGSPIIENTHHANVRKRKKKDELLLRSQQLRHFLLMRDSSNHKDISFVGSATGIIYFIRAVHNAMVIGDSTAYQANNQTPESDHAPGEDDDGPDSAMGNDWKFLWSSSEVRDGAPAFTFEDLMTWSRSYFNNWHPAYPFLHAPTLLDYFRQVTHHGLADRGPTDAMHKTILRSVMSISLADSRQSGDLAVPIPTMLVFSSYNDAVESASRVLTHPSSVLTLQAVLSVILFLVSMLRYNAASRLEGFAVRMLYQIGLHRCPYRFSAVPSKDALLSIRMFWSLYCIDRFINPSLGLPPAISDADIDMCIPGKERHARRGEENTQHDNRLNLMCFLARHAQIRGSIMSLRDRSLPRTQNEIDLSKKLDTDLTQWQNDLDDYMDIHDSEETSFNQNHRCVLTILRCESQMALHRPMLATPKDEPPYRSGLQNCISAARRAINTLYEALPAQQRQGRADELELRCVGLLWPSFTWATWLSSFVIIYAGTESEVTEGISARLVARGTEVLRHLSSRGSVWPDACMVATRELQSILSDEQGQDGRATRSAGPRIADSSRISADLRVTSTQYQPDDSSLVADRSAGNSHQSSMTQDNRQWQPRAHGINSSSDRFSNNSLPERVEFARPRLVSEQSSSLFGNSASRMQAGNPHQSMPVDSHFDSDFGYQGMTSLPPMLNDEINDMNYFGWQAYDPSMTFGHEDSNYDVLL